MKNNDIINNLANDNIIDDIQADIDSELAKTEPDYDKIAELTSLIAEISGNSISDDQISANITEISEKYDSCEKRGRIKVIYRWISAISACLVLVLALNAYTMVSFGDNLFKTVIEMTQSGFSIDFSTEDEPTTPQTTSVSEIIETTAVTANTTSGQVYTTAGQIYTTPVPLNTVPPMTTAPAGFSPATTLTPSIETTAVTPPGSSVESIGDIISEKCSEIGVETCSINYHTFMNLVDFSHEENELSTDCYFTFSDGNRQLDIIIEQYNNPDDIPNTLIPSNQYGYSAISGDVGEIFLFDENTHITAVFAYKNTVYTTIGHNFSSENIEEIMKTFSPEQN